MKAIAGTICLLLATSALAQDDFDALDRDRDGLLSRREALPDPRVSRNFDSLDRDRDGMLSAREYRLLLL